MLRHRLRLFFYSRLYAFGIARYIGHRARIRENLQKIYPEKSTAARYRMEKKIAKNIGRVFSEWHFKDGFMKQLEGAKIEGPGVPAMNFALATNRPIIFVSAHCANHLAIIQALKQQGVEMGVLYRRQGQLFANELQEGFLKATGQPLLKMGRRQDDGHEKALKLMVRRLAKRKNIGLLLDQRITDARIPFLDKCAPTSLAFAQLAIRYDALFLPGRAIREPDGLHFKFIADAPIQNTNPRKMMRQFNDLVSQWIADHPDQWFWTIKRW